MDRDESARALRANGAVSEDDGSKVRAQAAYELLDSWRVPPGLENGIVNVALLNDWVDKARACALERDRARVSDHEIGKILFYLPRDPDDNLWPHSALREMLERLQSREVEVGLRTEAINSRGVTHRGLQDGGAQERELEAMWREYAAGMGARWTRAQTICLDIADSYREQANWADDEVRKRRSKWSR